MFHGLYIRGSFHRLYVHGTDQVRFLAYFGFRHRKGAGSRGLECLSIVVPLNSVPLALYICGSSHWHSHPWLTPTLYLCFFCLWQSYCKRNLVSQKHIHEHTNQHQGFLEVSVTPATHPHIHQLTVINQHNYGLAAEWVNAPTKCFLVENVNRVHFALAVFCGKIR